MFRNNNVGKWEFKINLNSKCRFWNFLTWKLNFRKFWTSSTNIYRVITDVKVIESVSNNLPNFLLEVTCKRYYNTRNKNVVLGNNTAVSINDISLSLVSIRLQNAQYYVSWIYNCIIELSEFSIRKWKSSIRQWKFSGHIYT